MNGKKNAALFRRNSAGKAHSQKVGASAMSANPGIASYAFLLAARLVGIFILPAQVPGDPVGLIEELFTAPLATVRSWPSALVRQLLLQLVRLEKFTLPEDSQLVRLHTMRQRYLAAGWEATSVTTPDAVVLDALLRPPPAALAEPRFVLFVGGNFQKYEDWLPYFDAYARAAGVGFLAFNFRGVGRSEGAVCCAADMLTDVHACIDALLARGVRPAHLCVHGFSIGGAVSALALASRQQPGVAFVSDRSLRSLPHTIYGMVRGLPPSGALEAAAPRADDNGGGADDGEGVVMMHGRWVRPGLRAAALRRAECWVRGAAAAIAGAAVRALGWELPAEAGWAARIPGPKLVLYHRADNVVHYEAASLHLALKDAGDVGDVQEVEVRRLGHRGWGPHDFPLVADEVAWKALIARVRETLGVPDS